jgi:KDO2-lipid IV(A) lauroyltransferase
VLTWVIPNRTKRTALRNVERCFPDKPVAEQRRIARLAVTEELKLFLETPRLWLCSKATMQGYLKEERGIELLAKAFARGKGVILLTLHQGQFEQPAMCMSGNFTFTGLYKEQGGNGGGAAIDEASLKGRTRFGGKMPAVKPGIKSQIFPLLTANEGVYFVADQDPPEGRGVFAPFFGHPAHTPILVHNLAQSCDASILAFYGVRLPWGRGYYSQYVEVPQGVRDPDPVVSATAINALFEQCVLACPEQYWWTYKRFRRQPPGAPDFYAGTR